MTLKEFLKLNTNAGYLDIWLYLNDKLIDNYYKDDLENSIYTNNKVESFEIGDNELYISLKNF